MVKIIDIPDDEDEPDDAADVIVFEQTACGIRHMSEVHESEVPLTAIFKIDVSNHRWRKW